MVFHGISSNLRRRNPPLFRPKLTFNGVIVKPVSLITFLIVSVLAHSLWAQQENGLPFITSFPPKVYAQGTQNFAIIQNKQGILYIGNNNGVLVFDGHNWDLIPVINKSEVHSLAEDKDGRIYVGAQGDFGYLEQLKPKGGLEFVSLLSLVPPSARNFNDVWNIHVLGDAVIFRATSGIFIYRNGAIKFLELPTTTHRSFLVYDELFIRADRLGLRKLEGDSLVTIPEGERFTSEPIHSMFPYPGGKYLIVAQNLGMFLYDGRTFAPFSSPVNDLIQGQNIYGQILSDSTYVLGTRAHGILIMSKSGQLLLKLGKKEGLVNESVWAVCTDRFSGNLWVATNNGISFVEIQSPFSAFLTFNGQSAQSYQLANFKGDLYAATSLGVYYKSLTGAGADAFQKVENLPSQSWAFFQDEESLLAATNNGIFEIKDHKAINIGFTNRSWLFVPLRHHDNKVFVNTVEGFIILKKVNGKWTVHRNHKRFSEALYNFVEDNNGMIWADSPIKGIYKIASSDHFESDIQYTLYNSARGFPSDFKLNVFLLNDSIRFGTTKGIYSYSQKTDSVYFDRRLNEDLFRDGIHPVEWVEQDQRKNLWFTIQRKDGRRNYSSGGFANLQPNGRYVPNTSVFWRIHEFQIRDYLYINDSQTYVATSDGIFVFNPAKVRENPFPILLREIEFINRDSSITVDPAKRLYIPFDYNSMRFHFAGMNYSGNAHEYQTYLENFDPGWQKWSVSASKEYAQLPA